MRQEKRAVWRMKMKLHWERAEGDIIIYSDENQPLARLLGQKDAEDVLEIREKEILWKRITAHPAQRMVMEVQCLFAARHTMIPAVLYDGNPWGTDHEYKGYEWNGEPYVIAGHRSALPGASAVQGERYGFAMWSPGECAESLWPKEEGSVHRVIWPVEEGPRVLMADGWEKGYRESRVPEKEFIVRLHISGEQDRPAWQDMLDQCWQSAWHSLQYTLKAREVWERSVDYAKRLYTREEDGFKAFSIGFGWNGANWEKRREESYAIGWCGQNASLAVSLLYDHQLTKNKESLDMALGVLDSWVQSGRSREGFLLTRCYDEGKSLIDACNLGTYGYQLFEAADQLKALGLQYEKYEKAAFEICSFILERQELSGETGFSWNRDGSLFQKEGPAGCFLILALARAFRYTGEDRYRAGAEKAYEYYDQDFVQKGYGTSGALDTCCIDKESVIPLLKSGLLLYEETGEKQYLKRAEEAAWYLSTWQWHQTNTFPKGSALERIHYDTFGGTAVSTSHQHMDAFALCYVPDLWKLGMYTQKVSWKQRALAAWYNGIQVISDGNLEIYPEDVRPAGASDEGFMHTHWGRSGQAEKTGWPGCYETTRWLVAWPCAFRLEVLRKFILEDHSREELR